MIVIIILVSCLFLIYNKYLHAESNCGSEKANTFNWIGRACLWNGYKLNNPTQLTISTPSIDSGPVTYDVTTNAEQNVTILIDHTLDMYSEQNIETIKCTVMEKGLFTNKLIFKNCTQQGFYGKSFSL